MKKAIKGLSLANLILGIFSTASAALSGVIAFMTLIAGIFVDIFAFGGMGFRFLTVVLSNPSAGEGFHPTLLIPFYLIFFGGLFTLLAPLFLSTSLPITILSIKHFVAIKKDASKDEIQAATGLIVVGGLYNFISSNYLRAILAIIAGVLSLVYKEPVKEEVAPEGKPAEEEVIEEEPKEEPAEEVVPEEKPEPSKLAKWIKNLVGFTKADNVIMLVANILILVSGILFTIFSGYVVISSCVMIDQDTISFFFPMDDNPTRTIMFITWLALFYIFRIMVFASAINIVISAVSLGLVKKQYSLYDKAKYDEMIKLSAISSVVFAAIIFMLNGPFNLSFLLFLARAIVSFVSMPKKVVKKEEEEPLEVEAKPAE